MPSKITLDHATTIADVARAAGLASWSDEGGGYVVLGAELRELLDSWGTRHLGTLTVEQAHEVVRRSLARLTVGELATAEAAA